MNSRMEIMQARMRQMLADDRNAMEIYSDLAGRCDVSELKVQLQGIAKDEDRHMALSKEILDILARYKT